MLLFRESDESVDHQQTSLHFAAEAATALHWNRLSDHIGRKPILLSCLAGTIVSILLFGLSRSFWTILFRYITAHPPLWLRDTLTFGLFSQPLLAWRAEGKHRCREVYDGGAHGRNKHGTRIFVLVTDMGTWLRDRVEHLASRCPVPADDSRPLLALWSVGPYHGHKIAGHISSHTPSGPNIPTFSHAL